MPVQQGKFLPKTHACNCRKSGCLKLYCECFSSGEMCSSKCACANCFNNSASQKIRHEIIENILAKDPHAFNSKYEKNLVNKKSHKKGCNCRRSNCLKNYCECFQGKVACGSNCNCSHCHNRSENLKEEAGEPLKKLKI